MRVNLIKPGYIAPMVEEIVYPEPLNLLVTISSGSAGIEDFEEGEEL